MRPRLSAARRHLGSLAADAGDSNSTLLLGCLGDICRNPVLNTFILRGIACDATAKTLFPGKAKAASGVYAVYELQAWAMPMFTVARLRHEREIRAAWPADVFRAATATTQCYLRLITGHILKERIIRLVQRLDNADIKSWYPQPAGYQAPGLGRIHIN